MQQITIKMTRIRAVRGDFILLSVILVNISQLNVILPSVILLNVMAPLPSELQQILGQTFKTCNFL
jgi:hypothetical protein